MQTSAAAASKTARRKRKAASLLTSPEADAEPAAAHLTTEIDTATPRSRDGVFYLRRSHEAASASAVLLPIVLHVADDVDGTSSSFAHFSAKGDDAIVSVAEGVVGDVIEPASVEATSPYGKIRLNAADLAKRYVRADADAAQHVAQTRYRIAHLSLFEGSERHKQHRDVRRSCDGIYHASLIRN